MNGLFKTSSGDLRWGWKSAILIVGTVLVGILLSVILITVLTIGYSSEGLPQEQAIEKATTASGGFIAQVVLSILQLAFMLWLVRWLVTRIEKQKFEWWKLGLVSTERAKYVALGMGLAVALSLLTIAIGLVAGTLNYTGSGIKLFSPPQVVTTLLLSIVLALASGFGEEISFRGYLQSRIAQRYGPTVAILIVAVLFALSHPVAGSQDPLLYLVTATLVGILFGTIFARTGSLWMGITLHAVWNYVQIAILSVRNQTDGRFFGSPLFLFDTVSSTTQAFIELGVIAVGVLFVFWLTKPEMKTLVAQG